MSMDELTHPALRAEPLVETVCSFIRARSVTPDEGPMVEAVCTALRETKADCRLVESLPDRFSVGAVVKGALPGPTLVLNGHMDTVPAGDLDLWSTSPFDPEVRSGAVYGRGACDMKAGLAVMVAVAKVLSDMTDRLHGALVLHFAIGEEWAEPGTSSLVAAGFGGDVGITVEPTSLRVAVAQRGSAAIRIRITGRGGHASQPHLAANPIARVPAVLDVLGEYAESLRARSDPLLGSGSCTPTVLRAGEAFNVIPEACELVVDRRLVPGEQTAEAVAELRGRLDRLHRADPAFGFEVIAPTYSFEPSRTPSGRGFAELVTSLAREETGTAWPEWGTPYASDVGRLVNDGGIEAVTFGPGDVAFAHRPDEQVSVTELEAAARVVTRVASRLLLAP